MHVGMLLPALLSLGPPLIPHHTSDLCRRQRTEKGSRQTLLFLLPQLLEASLWGQEDSIMTLGFLEGDAGPVRSRASAATCMQSL